MGDFRTEPSSSHTARPDAHRGNCGHDDFLRLTARRLEAPLRPLAPPFARARLRRLRPRLEAEDVGAAGRRRYDGRCSSSARSLLSRDADPSILDQLGGARPTNITLSSRAVAIWRARRRRVSSAFICRCDQLSVPSIYADGKRSMESPHRQGGECFGLLGPNGAERRRRSSSRMPHRPTAATGRDPRKCAGAPTSTVLRGRIGISLQGRSYRKLTGFETIRLFRSFYTRTDPTAPRRAVADEAKTRASNPSGVRSRASPSVCVAGDPDICFR